MGAHSSLSGIVLLKSLRGWIIQVDAGLLQVPGDGHAFTLGLFRVDFMDENLVHMVPTDESFVIGHVGTPQFGKAFALRCGLGGMSMGATMAGLQILGGMDISKFAVECYNMSHAQHAMVGDLADVQSVPRISRVLQGQGVGFLLGFPRPPFSSRGDHLGFADRRAWVLVSGLELVYLLNSSFLLLECTPLVETYQQLVQFLDQFADTMQFRWKSQILHLDESWPVRRTRWWCLMVPESLHSLLTLSDLPRASHLQTVSSLLVTWPVWSPENEADLVWTEEETEFYEKFAVLSDLCLQCNAKRPTLLHGLAHLDRACPCGCRSSGLSEARLYRDGVSAVALRATHSDGLRHLHPMKAALLCTFPAHFRLPAGRSALPLLGQSAAPMQPHWMLTQLLAALQLQHADSGLVQLWPTKVTQVPRIVKLRFDSGTQVALEAVPNMTVEDLVAKQQSFGGWGGSFELSLNGALVPPNAILQEACYDVHAPRSFPVDVLSFQVNFNGRTWSGTFGLGVTVEALLLTLGFSSVRELSWVVGTETFDHGSRLRSSFVGRLQLTFRGAGPMALLGLSNFQIDAEAARLLRMVDPVDGFQFLTALDLSRLMTFTQAEVCTALWSLLRPDVHLVFGIYCFCEHWAAFSFDRDAKIACYHDGLEGFPFEAQFLIDAMADFWDLHGWEVRSQTVVYQTEGAHCGILWLWPILVTS